MRIGVIVNGGQVSRWQAEALQSIASDHRFVIFDAADMPPRKRLFGNAFYYLLNLFSVRNPRTASVPLPSALPIDDHVRFTPEADGAWERLPADVLQRIEAQRLDVLVKFGMGLLRVPPAGALDVPILSYHHGDPRSFRGRPAGFYEIMNGSPVVGQVVQILSNRLDAGAIVAFAETKAHADSWRRTLMEAYKVSPLLLRRAIANAVAGRRLPIEPAGRNYRLPSNAVALRFAARMAAAKLRRLRYGLFYEKRWRTAHAEFGGNSVEALAAALTDERKWIVQPLPPHYAFFADPFWHPGGEGMLVEAMRSDGRGEIVHAAGDTVRVVWSPPGHVSYPSTIDWGGTTLMVPEVSAFAAPLMLDLAAGPAPVRPMRVVVEGSPRLIDPTMFRHNGRVYLFANRAGEGNGVLRLWHSDAPGGTFAEHPMSPLRISPAGARMGGGIMALGGRLYRPGQDCRQGYGDGLILYEIEGLSPTDYKEREAATVRFRRRRGPHTVNCRGGAALFDFYSNRFSLLAGLRRFRQARAARIDWSADHAALLPHEQDRDRFVAE